MKRTAIGMMVVLAMTTAACAAPRRDARGGGPNGAPTASVEPTSTGAASTGPSSTTPAEPAGTQTVFVYHLVEWKGTTALTSERHRVPRTRSVARAALELMVRGQTQDRDHFSPWRGAGIRGINVRNGTATVDWTASVLDANVGSSIESLAIQQAVYTLTQFTSIRRVEFLVEGKRSGTASNGRRIEDWWGHTSLSEQPFSPADDMLAPISVWTPHDGAVLRAGDVKMTGDASTFEANVGLRLLDTEGHVQKQASATAGCAAPERCAWTYTWRNVRPGTYILEAYESSAEDGRDTFVESRSIRVR